MDTGGHREVHHNDTMFEEKMAAREVSKKPCIPLRSREGGTALRIHGPEAEGLEQRDSLADGPAVPIKAERPSAAEGDGRGAQEVHPHPSRPT